MQNGASFGDAMLNLVGKVWSLPTSVIGMAYGGVGYGVGLMMGTDPGISLANNAIQFTNNPLMATATTFGETNGRQMGSRQRQMGSDTIISMNGRVYDPIIGRFISADSVIPSLANSQSYNRYSYVYNNPMSGTDPSGHWPNWHPHKWIGSVARTIAFGGLVGNAHLERQIRHEYRRSAIFQGVVQVAGAVASFTICNGAGAACLAGWNAAFAIGEARADGITNGHALARQGAIAGATAAAMYQVGTTFKVTSANIQLDVLVENAVGHGVVGGLASMAQGGKFGSGFASGVVSGFADPYVANWTGNDPVAGAFAAAVVGGTTSVISGGKFANGAATVGFLMLFRSLPEIYKDIVGYELDGGPGGAAVPKGPETRPVEGANNIGVQKDPVDSTCWYCEGGSLSLVANQVPGINAVAGMHDIFQISYSNSFLRDIFNIPGMPVAAVLTYGGFLGLPLTVMTPQQIIFYTTSPAFNYDARRNK